MICFSSAGYSQDTTTTISDTPSKKESNGSVELTGDSVEYSVDGNKMIASGNVVLKHKGTILSCDRVEFSRDSKEAYAEGNVRLQMEQGEISGEKMTFNFESMTGTFQNAKIYAAPYYGAARRVAKVSDNKIEMEDGYMTTSDFDKPEYRMTAKKLEIYPGDKLIARNMRMVLGKAPIMYIPKFTQNLKEKKPKVIFTPGYDKEWGAFVLSQTRYYFNDSFKGIIHLDYRERKDFASGIDLNYKIPNRGTGIIKTYYMNERNLQVKHFFSERTLPTIERERFKVEWRHKWDVDRKTTAVLQYYRLSDETFLEDYFKKDNEEDSAPQTFFVLTRGLTNGIASFRTDARVNRFETTIERLPELSYDLSGQQLGETNFYFTNKSTYSNLSRKTASPSEVRQETMRVDTENEMAYLMKLGIFELKPFVGGRNTYYSKTKDPEKYGGVRGIFETGASLSTKFFRVYDVDIDKWGLNIKRLRHIITPSVSYEYNSEPTLSAVDLDQFDGIDTLDNLHSVSLSIENKLQTKRDGQSVDLLRVVSGVDFRLKNDPSDSGFNFITSEIDFHPLDYITLYFDSRYDTRNDRLKEANFDLFLNDAKDRWRFGVGKRFNREVDDQLTTDLLYKINPKWTFRIFDRMNLESGNLKEQEYTLTRDLHAWEMDLNFNETEGEGSEIWVIFRLKAFPEAALDFGTSFNKRKAGSQSE